MMERTTCLDSPARNDRKRPRPSPAKSTSRGRTVISCTRLLGSVAVAIRAWRGKLVLAGPERSSEPFLG